MVTINSNIIKWAIENSPIKKEEIAKKIKVSGKTIDNWVSGKKKMTFAQAKKLSKVLECNPTIFLLDKPLSESKLPMDFRMNRNVKELGIKSIHAIKEAKYIQEKLYEIKNLLDMDLEPDLISVRLDSNPLKIAEKIRSILKIEELTNVKNDDLFFERLREELYRLNVIMLLGNFPYEEIKGFSLSAVKPYMIVINNADPFPKSKIFTLFHELGHLLLRKDGICFPDEVDMENNDGKEKLKIERWCNKFAAYVLVGPEKINNEFNGLSIDKIEKKVKEISSKYHISKTALYITLYENNIIDFNTYNNYRSQFEESKIKKGKGGRSIPLEKRRIKKFGKKVIDFIYYAHDERVITTHDVMSILSIKLDDYDRVRNFASK